MIGSSDWEPTYDRGTGVYETRHEPPKFVFYQENERGQATMRSTAKATREEAEQDMARSLAFHEKFWRDRIGLARTDSNTCVIAGGFYRVGPDRGDRSTRGFAGRQFFIARHDGTLIETRNLWFGGEIPRAFRELIPDNAEFINGERWITLGGVDYLIEGAS